ncbi:oligopeptidase B [Arthrobacter sp. MYb229]|uniref:S9 family peptidase n=1 Tax=unclassified Arthrobacter TaxID=235627 RepID=UPI000CFC096D|nr:MULTISPECIES: S9 family peptidase [unclassified Arthrobacter]PRA06005.1 oligopeptidase B [Arthrobacter sp. MYb229]PRB52907.1 oligopeptidase B [Arthrobacter sp. MYb216]
MTSASITASAPLAAKIPTIREFHGDNFTDDYEWLREKTSKQVLDHLHAENAYTDAVTADQEELRQEIFKEIKARTVETDLSVPTRRRGWWYYTRSVEGKPYTIQCRVKAEDSPDARADWTPPVIDPVEALPGEQVLLDGNELAEGQSFFALGGMAINEPSNLLAYCIDTQGDERFTLYIKDLETGQLLPDVIEGVFYGLAFSPDSSTVYYLVVDDTWRPHQVRAHVLGSDPASDTVVFQEDDPGMWLGFDLSADLQQLLISSGNSEYAETSVLDLNDKDGQVRLLVPRELRLLHGVDLLPGDDRRALITHDHQAPNNMLSLVELAQLGADTDPASWRTVLGHESTVKIEGTALTATHLVVSVRRDTCERVQLIPLESLGTESQLPVLEPAFDEELFTAAATFADLEAPLIRIGYTSDFTPARVYDLWLDDKELVLRKQTPVNDYDSADYLSTREWATAADGTKIPLTVMRRADLDTSVPNPVLIYGYGSYEVSMDPGFGIPRLSVLDRGVVFVIAHVRGGGELGRDWYLQGKKLAKRNTFTDFIDATRYLIDAGWADPARIAALGGSAGGLLMGAIANLAPQLYTSIIAQVPFVDPLTSILDPELPLSALEWEEWGNPIEDKEVYEYMKAYSPYENVTAVDYPRIAAVTSLNDTRVLYVEPAKWVAKLREVGTGSEPILLKTEMEGGHGGASGRYEAWKNRAWDYAFALDALGKNPATAK